MDVINQGTFRPIQNKVWLEIMNIWTKNALNFVLKDILDEYVKGGYDTDVIDRALDEWTWSLEEFLEVRVHLHYTNVMIWLYDCLIVWPYLR